VADLIALARRIIERFLMVEPLERALALASKLFIALIPTTILTSSVFGTDTSFGDALVERFSLTGAGASAVRQLFASPDQVRGGISALGILVLAYAVLSMAQALQRIYEDAWGLKRIRARGTFRALIWMFTFALYFTAISPLRAQLRQADSRALRIYLPFVLGSVIWAVTPYILLGGRVPGRRLLATGILTAVALTVFSGLHADRHVQRRQPLRADRSGFWDRVVAVRVGRGVDRVGHDGSGAGRRRSGSARDRGSAGHGRVTSR
jgi:membrane protein